MEPEITAANAMKVAAEAAAAATAAHTIVAAAEGAADHPEETCTLIFGFLRFVLPSTTIEFLTKLDRAMTEAGVSWQSVFIALAVILVPWTLFVAAIVARFKAKAAGMEEARGLVERGSSHASQNKEPGGSEAGSVARTEPTTESRTTASANPASRGNVRRTSSSAGTRPHDDDVLSEEEEENLPPLHLHTLRVPARLHGTATPPLIPHTIRSRSNSRSSARSRSRSASPAPPGGVSGGPPSIDAVALPNFDGNSSISSIDDVDPDILLDKMGFEDVGPPPPHTAPQHPTGLITVVERMSEDTLDDVHAFSDVHHSSGSAHGGSRSGSVTGGSIQGDTSVLETLNEEAISEGEEDEDEEGAAEQQQKQAAQAKKEGDKEETQQQQDLSHEILFELLESVSVTEKEREDLQKTKKEREETKK